jgi:hypothetical protein
MISSPREADSWIRSVQSRLPEASRTYTAAFLAASASSSGWIPRLCGVRHQGKLAGVVYVKERTLAGLKTGLIYGDSVLGNLVAAEFGHEEGVLFAGLAGLLSRRAVRGLRISIPPDGYEQRVIEQVRASLPIEVVYRPIQNHSILRLATTYDEFLESLGRRTRRNFRYYRRRFEATSNVYVERMEFSEFKRAAEELLRRKVVGASPRGVRRALAVLSAVDRPVLTGLRTEAGVWLAVLAGWYTGENAVVFMQMNNERDYADSSLALVLRSFLVEKVIAEGGRGLIFWAGVGGPIARYVFPLPTVAAYLDKVDVGWRIFRRGVAKLGMHLPGSLSRMTEWVIARRDVTEE